MLCVAGSLSFHEHLDWLALVCYGVSVAMEQHFQSVLTSVLASVCDLTHRAIQRSDL